MQIISKIYFDSEGRIVRKELVPIRQENSDVNILQVYLPFGEESSARLFCRLPNRQTYSFPRGADTAVRFNAEEKMYYAEFVIDDSATKFYGELDCTISIRQSIDVTTLEEPETRVKVNNLRMFSWQVEETSMTDHTLTSEEQDDVLDLQNDVAILKEDIDNNRDQIESINNEVEGVKTNYLKKSEKGVTVATLEGGKIPANQLPSYVDDVLDIEVSANTIPLFEDESELPKNTDEYNELFGTNEGAGGGAYYAILGMFDRYSQMGGGNIKIYKVFYYQYMKFGTEELHNWKKMFDIVTGKIYVDKKTNDSFRSIGDNIIGPTTNKIPLASFLIKIASIQDLERKADLVDGKLPESQLPSGHIVQSINMTCMNDAIPLFASENELPTNLEEYNVAFNTSLGASGGIFYSIVGIQRDSSIRPPRFDLCYYQWQLNGTTISNWQEVPNFKFSQDSLYIKNIYSGRESVVYYLIYGAQVYIYDYEKPVNVPLSSMFGVIQQVRLGEEESEAYPGNKGKQNAEDIVKLKTEINHLKSIVYETVVGTEYYLCDYMKILNIPLSVNTYPVILSVGCEINKIEGNSVVWNQLQKVATSSITKTVNGITMTDNRDGSYTISGTATADAQLRFPEIASSLKLGHKYLIKGCPQGGSDSTYYLWSDGWNTKSPHDIGEGTIYDYGIAFRGYLMIFVVKSGVELNNLIVRPQLFDLTLMFGEGNEPITADGFNEIFSEVFYEYNAGKVISAKFSKIESYDSNNVLLDSVSIGKEIELRSTNDISPIRDSLDFVEQADGTYELIKTIKIGVNELELFALNTPQTEVLATNLTFDDVNLLMQKNGYITTDYRELPPNVTLNFAVSKIKEENGNV